MIGLPTISRGIGYGPLSTISRGYLTDFDPPPPDPGDSESRIWNLTLSLQLKL